MTYNATAAITLLALAVYCLMGIRVAQTRAKVGIAAPAMTGNPLLERTIRAHENTLEWLPVFLPSLWLFAIYWGDWKAAIVGAVWIAGRIVYFLGYVSDAHKRERGFMIQAFATLILLLGALGRAVYLLAVS
jgi:uncharacterized membrane protein YecN with MAPEG domain